MGQHNRKLGEWGEAKAAKWYQQHGYRVVDRNWRHSNRGELDLIVAKGDQLVFCEVKTRSNNRYGRPIEAITPAKAQRIRMLAAAWRTTHDLDHRRCRYDVASIVAGDLQIYKGVL